MVEPHCSNFRVITTNFLGVWIFRKFMVILGSNPSGECRQLSCLCCRRSRSIYIHAKVVVNSANRQPYQLGWRAITAVPFTLSLNIPQSKAIIFSWQPFCTLPAQSTAILHTASSFDSHFAHCQPGLGKTEIFSVPDRNLEIGTDWKQPKVPKNRSHTGPILRKFSPILSDI